MQKHPELTEQRIAKAVEQIAKLVYAPCADLRLEAWHAEGEPVPFEQAVRQTFVPFAVGDGWGAPWSTTWFRVTGKVPEAWRGRQVVALFDLGFTGGEGFTAEGLVWQNGVPRGAVNVHHREVVIVDRARGGEDFCFYIEAAANCSVEQERDWELGRRPIFHLRRAAMACFNPAAWDLWHDFRVCAEAMQTLPMDAPRRAQLRYALNQAVNVFEETDEGTWFRARGLVGEVMRFSNGDSTHHVSAVGHAHIDTAWLWPLRETIRKCARTFSTALDCMRDYPEFVFACSQAQQYAWMKAFYPTIYEGIKKAVKRGQWEPVGSMWVEADCNIPSGESLVRQILYGRNFFLDEFGIETAELWLPDVFGYSAALPQILRQAGIRYFLTQKISWSQFNRFPHHTFEWEGIDGTRVFTHFPPADTYNGTFKPAELAFSVRNFREHDRARRSLYLFGYGDGGGGPTRTMLETARRLKDFEGMPLVKIEKARDFFLKAEREAKDLPVWVGELYLELHRGTYTTQARNKRGNRKGETLLHNAEFMQSMVETAGVGGAGAALPRIEPRAPYDVTHAEHDPSPAAFLERAWKLLLLNQFHDIIPGSSIGAVYRDSARDYATITRLGSAVRDAARARLTSAIHTAGCRQPHVVFNATSFPRQEVVSLPDGTPVHVEVPACGYTVMDAAAERPVGAFAQPVRVVESKKGVVLHNGLLQVTFDVRGRLTGVFDVRHNREVLAPGCCGNVFQLHKDTPNNWDAWDVDIFYRETATDIDGFTGMRVIEHHPLRARLRIERAFGRSRIGQVVTLTAGSPRIDFFTEIEWHEDHRFLKVAFPVAVRAMRATYEIQFGSVERPTHQNTSWDMAQFEVCAQRWADLSEGDYGVALLNDCKYGYDVLGNVLRLSLLRAPSSPDPNADRGRHELTYSLLPHRFCHRMGGVIEQACALNNPLEIVATDAHDGTLPREQSFFSVDRPNVVIDTVKNAERENAVIVRLYEAHGTRGQVELRTPLSFRSVHRADLMERSLARLELEKGALRFNVRPYEIVTLKFTRG